LFSHFHNLTAPLKRLLRGQSSRRGQTSIVLIVIIAIALVFYAASLNWGRITQYKTLTVMASNLAAANMASTVTSWGEYQLQDTLGGRPEYCERTNFFVMVIVLAIVIVISIFTFGAAAAALAPLFGAVVAGVIVAIVVVAAIAMAATALFLNLAIIQPGMVSLWNRMQADMQTIEDRTVESGIMVGLESSVTDPVMLDDNFDMNADGQWVDKFGVSNMATNPNKISRFGFFYTMRLRFLSPVKVPEVDLFVSNLKELLYDNPYNKIGDKCTTEEKSTIPLPLKCETPDNWGLFDPKCIGSSATPEPYCNACCQPVSVRPKSCDDPKAPPPVVSAKCTVPDGDYPSSSYAFQYDPFRENFDNSFLSFREKLGIDDDNEIFNKNPVLPDGLQVPGLTMEFMQKDATGSTGGIEKRTGVYPFFWKMGSFLMSTPVTLPLGTPPANKSDNIMMVTYNPLDGTNRFEASETTCALNAWLTDIPAPPAPKGFWWKPGMNHYCSTDYPYNDCKFPGSCKAGKFDGSFPTCGCMYSSDHTAWREDPVDYLVDGLTGFIAWSQKITNLYRDKKASTYTTFPDWYPGAASWIAPKCDPSWNCEVDSVTKPIQCESCNHQDSDGYLLIWRDQLANWIDLLDKWLYGSSAVEVAPANLGDDKSWCLPTSQAALPKHELQSILVARAATPPKDRTGTKDLSPVWGDLNDTIACLNFNQNNDTKFSQCYSDCTSPTPPVNFADHCLNLPRTTTDLATKFDAEYINAQKLQDCLSSGCWNASFTIYPECQGLGALGVTQAINCTSFSPGNLFYDNVKAVRDDWFLNKSNVCKPVAPATSTEFQDKLKLSADAADIQVNDPVNGFKARAKYLEDLRKEALNARSVFYEGYTKFNDFLEPCAGYGTVGAKLGEDCGECKVASKGGSRPAANLMCARQNFTSQVAQLPNFAIYGWRSPRSSALNIRPSAPGLGYWHIVRVEAFAPKRCYHYCGINDFPKVHTYIKWEFNFWLGSPDQFQCYKLENTDGYVIVRVTRFDEDHDTFAKFANGQLLWNFRFKNPSMTAPAGGTVGLETICAPPTRYLNDVSPLTKNGIADAFMINTTPDKDPRKDIVSEKGNLGPCWNLVNALLNTGVQTTTCARYYLDDKHMSLRFTPCPAYAVEKVFGCAATTGTCPGP
jgi:hypothetical protein